MASVRVDDIKYKSNYRKLFGAVTFDHIANQLSSSALIVAYALYLGMSELFIGLFLSLRIIFMVVAVFSSPLFSKIGQSKSAVITMAFLYRASAYAVILIPFITGDVLIRAIIFCVLMSLSSIFAHFNYAPLVNWRMQMLKPDDQKKFFAQKNFVVLLLTAILSLTLSYLLDTYVDTNFAYGMFVIILSTIMVLALIEFVFRAFMYKPPITEKSNVSVLETIVMPMKNKNSRQTILFCVFLTFFVSLGTLYLPVYLIKYLEFSFLYITVLLIISTVGGMLAGFVFGKLAVRKKNYNLTLVVGTSLMIINLGLYSILGDAVVFLVPVLAFIFGFGATGFNLFEGIAIHENAPSEYKTTTLSCYKFYSGLLSILLVAVTFLLIGGDNAVIIRVIFGVSAIGLFLTLVYYTCFIRRDARVEIS